MRDIDLYRAILGLTPPWTVVDVELDVKGQDVTVRVDAGEGPFPCPECRTPIPGYNRKRRRWRHLNTCQFTTCAAVRLRSSRRSRQPITPERLR
jgi:transposase